MAEKQGFLARLFGRERKNASVTNLSLDQMMELLRGGSRAKSGVVVNSQSALKVSTVLACVRKIADGNASVPIGIYQKKGASRVEASDHPLNDILAFKPNSWQTSLEFREMITFHLVLTGNAFVFIVRDSNGKRISELIPIPPDKVTIKPGADYSLSYLMAGKNGDIREVGQRDIWHIRGPSWDGVCGLDAVSLAREAIGLALATEQSHAQMHGNGVMPSGILAVEGNLDESNLVRLAAWVRANYAGLDNSGQAMVMDHSAKWQPLRMSGVDSEHIATRKHQVIEICHDLGVLPAVIGVPETGTSYNSVEQMFQAHLVHTVRPWHRRLAGSANRWLLSEEDRKKGYYVVFNIADFLSPSMKDKAEFYRMALGGAGNPGWMTINEARSFEELPPYEGGDFLYAQQQLGPIQEDGTPKTPKTPKPPAAEAAPAASPPKPNAGPSNIGRVISSKNEKLLRSASTQIAAADADLQNVLKQLDEDNEE